MSYIENPIVEGKDFESTAKDVNGNFTDINDRFINNSFATYEKIGETRVTGTSGKWNIPCVANKYETLIIIARGTLGAYSKIITADDYNLDSDKYSNFFSNSNTTGISAGVYKTGVYINSGDSFSKANVLYRNVDSNCDDFPIRLERYSSSSYTQTDSDIVFELYGIKRPKILLDALGYTD